MNGDSFLERKKGKAFMDLEARCKIVDSLKHVSYTVPYEAEEDGVDEALKLIRPDVFTKGGTYKDAANIREWDTCKFLGIRIVIDVGDKKYNGSSDYLFDWGRFCIEERERILN